MLGPGTIGFLKDLKANNNRDWFKANKARYEAEWKQAGAAFSEAVAAELGRRLETTIGHKIYRLNRDLRFSKDKTPYNTHLHISFIPGEDGQTTPVFMIGIEPDKLSIGMGVFAFDKSGLAKWRDAITSPPGTDLIDEIQTLMAKGLRFNEPELKRVPSGYPAEHENAEWLRRKGLHVWYDSTAVDECFGPEGPHHCTDRASAFFPLFKQLVRALN